MTMMVDVKERPILFSVPMVRALLEGRKTQTRRAIKTFRCGGLDNCVRLSTGGYAELQDEGLGYHPVGTEWKLAPSERINDWCPYGSPGERLWVRETYAIMSTDGHTASVAYRERMPAGKTLADTDGGLDLIELSTDELIWADAHIDGERWRPSIFMPRWASRITLEITEVRVQRLQEITEDDAKAEGAEWYGFADLKPNGDLRDGESVAYRAGFHDLWQSINGEESWKSNPWVWAITFKAVR
jgi:hypothetical protein